MSELEMSRLVGNIYDAALDHRLWPCILQQICDFVRASGANLYSQDITSTKVTLHYAYGEDPRYVQLYFDKYLRMNPLYPALTFFNIGEVHSLSDVIPYDEFYETRFYKEWARPQGIVDVLFANLEKTATGSAVLAVRRYERDGLVDEEARRRMSLLIPHVRRAVLIGDVISLRDCQAATFLETLNGIAAGAFLISASGRIVHANISGQKMLDGGDVLRKVGGLLTAVDLDANQIMKDVFAAARNGDTAIGIDGVAVSLKDPRGEHYVAHVLPLTGGARRRAANDYAVVVAAVFVHKASFEAASAPDLLAKTYGLTAMELRVLLGIVQVGGAPMVAEDLGISETTVRTHLKHVFEKTGTNRQVDLVNLVAAFESRLLVAAR